jgi:hypothetical protein
MQRIDDATATEDQKFKEGTPGGSDPATRLRASWLNDVQEELVTTIEAAGLTPTGGEVQLYKALINLTYRVGDYIHTESAVSPNERWPWQTWAEVSGRVLVGLDGTPLFDTIGKEGGSVNITIPRDGWRDNSAGALPSPTTRGRLIVGSGSSENSETLESLQHAEFNRSFSGANMPPYRTVRMWRRTA